MMLRILLCVWISAASVTGLAHARWTGPAAPRLTTYGNPCTPEMLDAGHFYHAYPEDPTRFLQCNAWGKVFLRSCPPGEVWSQPYETCVEGTGVYREVQPEYRPAKPVKDTASNPGPPNVPTQARRMRMRMYHKNNNDNRRGQGMARTGNREGAKREVRSDYPAPSMRYEDTSDPMVPLLKLILMARTGLSNDMKEKDPDDRDQDPKDPKMDHSQPEPDSPCASGKIRYFPEKSNLRGFYECIDGQEVRRSCPADNIWVQPLRQCEDPNNSAEHIRGSPNPCVGSDVRYHPYPADPTMYVECDPRLQVYLYRCGRNELWVQPLQRCVDRSLMHPIDIKQKPKPQPTPTPTPDSAAGIPGKPCIKGRRFYYPDPTDETRFIQCDEFGNMYFMRCGFAKVWDNITSTCVGSHNMGQVLAVQDGTGNQTTTMTTTKTPPTETPGTQPSSDIPAYIIPKCRKDFNYSPELGTCVKVVDPPTDHEMPYLEHLGPQCEDTHYWDEQIRLCLPRKSGLHFISGIPKCNDDEFWDNNLFICLPRTGMGQPRDFDLPPPLPVADETLNDPAVTSYDTDQDDNAGYSDVDDQDGVDMTGGDMMDYVGAAVKVPSGLYLLEKPCGQDEGFYFPFILDNRFFIQCDQMGNMYIMPCPISSLWNTEQTTCVPYTTPEGSVVVEISDDENGGTGATGTDATGTDATGTDSDSGYNHVDMDYGADDQDTTGADEVKPNGNICSIPGKTYHAHPKDPRQFIMCIFQYPFSLFCAGGAVWNDKTEACCFYENSAV